MDNLVCGKDVGGLATQSGRCFGKASMPAEAPCGVCLDWSFVQAEVSHCVWFLGRAPVHEQAGHHLYWAWCLLGVVAM